MEQVVRPPVGEQFHHETTTGGLPDEGDIRDIPADLRHGVLHPPQLMDQVIDAAEGPGPVLVERQEALQTHAVVQRHDDAAGRGEGRAVVPAVVAVALFVASAVDPRDHRQMIVRRGVLRGVDRDSRGKPQLTALGGVRAGQHLLPRFRRLRLAEMVGVRHRHGAEHGHAVTR